MPFLKSRNFKGWEFSGICEDASHSAHHYYSSESILGPERERKI
jgi:hypothetical protein